MTEKMAPVNLDILLDMGFDRVRAELAAQQPGGSRSSLAFRFAVVSQSSDSRFIYVSSGSYLMARAEPR